MKSQSEKYSSFKFSVLSRVSRAIFFSPLRLSRQHVRQSRFSDGGSCLPTKTDVSRAMIICLSTWFFAAVSVFAESYPNRPTADEMDENVAQGIICGKAVRERELAVNRSQSFLPYCGVWQPYIVSLQQELETLASIYIDHENGPLTDAGDEFLYFTLDNWRAAAGLNAGGFRRSTDGTTFYYGQMQAGDIIGPWIFEDLQKGFSALKWTLQQGKTVETRFGSSQLDSDDYAGYTAAAAAWTSASWNPGSYHGYNGNAGSHSDNISGSPQWECVATRIKYNLIGPNDIPRIFTRLYAYLDQRACSGDLNTYLADLGPENDIYTFDFSNDTPLPFTTPWVASRTSPPPFLTTSRIYDYSWRMSICGVIINWGFADQNP